MCRLERYRQCPEVEIELDLKTLEAQFDDLQARYDEWVKPIRAAKKEKLPRINRDGYTLMDYEREMEAIEQQARASFDPFAASMPLLDELSAHYLPASA